MVDDARLHGLIRERVRLRRGSHIPTVQTVGYSRWMAAEPMDDSATPNRSAVPSVDNGLEGRVVIVTGASSGLGRRFARVLAENGAFVSVTARRVERLEELRAEYGADRIHVEAGDISDETFPARLVGSTVERFGRLDILVNNAGTGSMVRAEEESTEHFLQVIKTNLVAVFVCCREAYGPMRDNGGGSIVNVSSMLGQIGIGRIPQASYCASKGGVANLTRELAAQWARSGIRVNCLAPGWFPTEMTEAMMTDKKGLAFIDRTVPMRRAGRADELDNALLFLAGAGSSYVTGQTLVVDGGYTAI
jgi:NAD(P)-dependent dehydrogenase (short-subunit alcohol dehydrogenase family)